MNIDAKVAKRLIDHVGGARAFARVLDIDYDAPGQPQRVWNWKNRGMPSAVVVANYEVLKRLKRQARA